MTETLTERFPIKFISQFMSILYVMASVDILLQLDFKSGEKKTISKRDDKDRRKYLEFTIYHYSTNFTSRCGRC